MLPLKIIFSISITVCLIILSTQASGIWLQGLQITMLILVSAAFLLFFSSLLPNKTPLITRYAYLIDGALTDQERSYTRGVTWAWLGVLSITILLKTTQVFDLKTIVFAEFSGLIWGALPLLFIGEFYLRLLLFKHKDHGSFLGFIQKTIKIPIKEIWLFDKRP